VRKLDKEQVDFLLDHQTLERWAGLTLKERTIFFHRRFPHKRIAQTSLRRFYLQHKVKRKKVRQEKHMPPHVRQDYAQKCLAVLAQIERAKEEGRRIIFLDEVNFTKRSVA
jgi:hypothetical protein